MDFLEVNPDRIADFITGDTHGFTQHRSTKAQHSHLGGATTDIHNHGANGLRDGETGTDGSGHRLIDDDAVAAVRTDLLPLADLITPNVPEAAALLDVAPAADVGALHEQARALLSLGPRAVLLKGGHLGGSESVDVLATPAGSTESRRPRIDTTATHGTGCTLSSGLAALAARAGGTPDWAALVEPARDYLQRALAATVRSTPSPRPSTATPRASARS